MPDAVRRTGLRCRAIEQRLYVTCEGRQEVLVVDVTSRRILHAIPTNQAGSHMLALSADGSRAYVSNFWHGTVSVLDLRARRILAQIATGSGTEGISLSPDDRHVYTSSVYINEIVKIDTGTLQVVGRARMGNCLGAVRVVPTPVDGRTLVVNCADNGRVLIIEAGTLSLTHQIPVGTIADRDRGAGRPLCLRRQHGRRHHLGHRHQKGRCRAHDPGRRRPRRHRVSSRLTSDLLLSLLWEGTVNGPHDRKKSTA